MAVTMSRSVEPLLVSSRGSTDEIFGKGVWVIMMISDATVPKRRVKGRRSPLACDKTQPSLSPIFASWRELRNVVSNRRL
ncbi:hypothetical protein AN958_00024 [Leucoagaricus sp. SymC.cos]|nr:hypothetical protein AN958_00024 [Leucoagaricus sp. SymC.cos]